MRLTRRTGDGPYMATLVVKFKVESAEVAELLCRYADPDEHRAPELWKPRQPGKDTITRSQVEALIRRALHGWGTGAYLDEDAWDLNYNDEQAATLAAWAAAQIRRLYPAWNDAKLAEFEASYPFPNPDDEEDGDDS